MCSGLPPPPPTSQQGVTGSSMGATSGFPLRDAETPPQYREEDGGDSETSSESDCMALDPDCATELCNFEQIT